MLVLKMMSNEDKADSNPSKRFELLCCDNVEFIRKDGKPFAKVLLKDDLVEYELSGNAYVMQNGKTIASFAFSDIGE